MKSLHEKRQDALMRMISRQQRDEAKLEDAKADRRKMEKTAPKNGDVLIKHGLLAGFKVSDQKDALDRHIAAIQREVDRRNREIGHLRVLVAQGNKVSYI